MNSAPNTGFCLLGCGLDGVPQNPHGLTLLISGGNRPLQMQLAKTKACRGRVGSNPLQKCLYKTERLSVALVRALE